MSDHNKVNMWFKLNKIFSIFLFGVLFVTSNSLRISASKLEGVEDSDPGERLILTPLIEKGKIEEAIQKATVGNITEFNGVTSYSGYLTVNKSDESNLFFWFFPAQEIWFPEHAPVILWLQGSPSDSSLLGLFSENGPFEIGANSSIKTREHSWTKTQSVLYIDNPVGVGFSFTNGQFRTDQNQVGNDLYEALKQFFTLFSDFKNSDFVVAGESYGGKYATTIAYKIHKENPNASTKINLKAVAIDSGWVDPVNQINYSDFALQAGLIDPAKAASYKVVEKAVAEAISNQKWTEAIQKLAMDVIVDLRQTSGLNNDFNFLIARNVDAELKALIKTFLDRNDVRAAIHVGNTEYGGEGAKVALIPDMIKSNAPKMLELLNNYRVLTFNGQVDIIVAYPLTVNYLQKLQFNGSEEYRNATRKQWKVDGELAGYVKVGGNLTEVMVRNAGHMIAHDQPAWVYDLIYKFVRNQPIA